MAQALYIGNADEYLPDWQQVSRALAARRVREIDMKTALPIPIRPAVPFDGDTNHLCVVDAQGNAVSITQSIGPTFGSKTANPELGFMYAYSYDMNDDPILFQREKTSQSPTMVLKNDRLVLILGSAGSSRIPASIVQTIVNVIDHNMTLNQAVTQRRCFLYGETLRLETMNLPDNVLQNLRGYGYRIQEYPELNGYFGRVHAIQLNHDKDLIYGISDPRDFGGARGY